MIHGLAIRNANFATGIIITLNGEDRWAEPEDVEAFAQRALEVVRKAKESKP